MTPVVVTSFDSMTALVDSVASLPRGRGRGTDWEAHCAGVSFAQSLDLARHGWADGARRSAEMASRIADRIVAAGGTTTDTEIGYDVCGAAYDAGAYLSGSPECWATIAPTERKKAVRIVLNCSVSYAVSPETLLARGIAISALVLALQSRGFPVTVDVVEAMEYNRRGKRDSHARVVRVIDANGSPLDVDRLVFAVAHPSVARHIMRAHACGLRDGDQPQAARWGDSFPLSDWRPDGEVDLFIGGIRSDYDGERFINGGEDWVLAEYERQTAA